MDKHNTSGSEAFWEAIVSLKTADECLLFFRDLCTVKELLSFYQRYEVACMLDAGKNYNDVSEKTGASSATISRVNKCLLYGDGGYRIALDRTREKRGDFDGK